VDGNVGNPEKNKHTAFGAELGEGNDEMEFLKRGTILGLADSTFADTDTDTDTLSLALSMSLIPYLVLFYYDTIRYEIDNLR